MKVFRISIILLLAGQLGLGSLLNLLNPTAEHKSRAGITTGLRKGQNSGPGGSAVGFAIPTLPPPAGEDLYFPVLSKGPTGTNVFGIDLGQIRVENGLEQFSSAGTAWIRRGNFHWSAVEPAEGERKWETVAGIEAELVNAARYNLQPILVVQDTPEWARRYPNSACGPLLEVKYEAFSNFMYDLVTRYSQPPYNVKYWEIFNEPDAPLMHGSPGYGCWGNLKDKQYYGGKEYGRLLLSVYPKIKAADPQAKVLLGGLLLDCDPDRPPSGRDCNMSRFFEGVMAAGAGNYFDVVSFHTYDYYHTRLGDYGNAGWYAAGNTTGPSLVQKAAFIRKVLDKYGFGDKPLMNTENALLCGTVCDEQFEDSKAAYVAESYAAAIKTGLQANIWYDVFGPWQNNGLLRPNLSPLPAFQAFEFAQTEIGGARFVQEVSLAEPLRVNEFLSGTRKIWQVKALVAGEIPLFVDPLPSAAYDMLGNPIPVTPTILVGVLPVYLEWDKHP